jgi:putative flippase GtrA
MANTQALGSIERLRRYYQAGIVNTAFGYGLFALFVALGLNMYLAQIAAHLLGVAFNYFTYSRHAFHDAKASKLRFVLSYAAIYVLGLASLWAASQVIASPYLAGFVAVVFVTLVNYLVLRHWVFTFREER